MLLFFLPGRGRGRGRRMASPQSATATGSVRPSVVGDVLPSDLVGTMSDEDYGETELPRPVPEVVDCQSTDAEYTAIKSEPVDTAEDLTSQADLPGQLVEHSYSYTDHIDCTGSQYQNPQTVEEQPLSRTSGYKYAHDEEYVGEDIDKQCGMVVVRMRKKKVPPITNRLIIPIVRVAKTALTTQNVLEYARNEMDIYDGHSGENVLFLSVLHFAKLYTDFFFD